MNRADFVWVEGLRGVFSTAPAFICLVAQIGEMVPDHSTLPTLEELRLQMDKQREQATAIAQRIFGINATVTGSLGTSLEPGSLEIRFDGQVIGSGATFQKALTDAMSYLGKVSERTTFGLEHFGGVRPGDQQGVAGLGA
jgi:hypothetical protein